MISSENPRTFSRRRAGLILAILVVGGLFAFWAMHRTDRNMRGDLIKQARLLAAAVNIDRVLALTGTEADLDSPNYLRIKEQLANARRTNKNCRFMYLMGRLSDGRVFFYVDSEPAGSEDESPPGQVFGEISTEYLHAFDAGAELVEGPVSDRWGTWVSALIPMTDPKTGDLIAFFGMDITARTWKWSVAAAAVLPMSLTFVLIILVIFWIAAAQDRAIATAELAKSEKRFRMIYENAPVLIDAFDVNGRCVLWNKHCRETFGWTIDEINAHDDTLSIFYPDPVVRKEVVQSIIAEPDGRFRQWHPKTKDGKTLVTLWANFRLPDGSTISLGYDITEQKQAEEALRKSEGKFRLLADNASDVIWTMDMEWNFTFVSPSVERVFGFTVEQALEKRLEDIIPPESLETILGGFQQTASNAGGAGEVSAPLTFEVRQYRSDRSLFWTEVNISIVQQSPTSCYYFQGVTRDISERKQAEEKLREANQIVNKSPAVAFLWKNAEGWPVEFASDNVKKMFGYSPEEFINDKGLYSRIVHPEDLKRINEEIARFSKEDGLTDFIHAPYRIFTKSGQVKWIDDWTTIRRNESGDITHYQGIVLDISERKQAEEKLRFQAHLIGQIQDMITATDLEGRITYVNEAVGRFFACSPEDLIGKHVEDFGEDADHGATQQEIIDQTLAEGSWFGDVVNYLKDGNKYILYCRTQLLRDEYGQPIGMIGISSDITERKQAEALIQVRADLLEFAVSHSLSELFQKTLDEVCALIGSPIGFYHFVDADQKTLTLQAWSARTEKEFCKTDGKKAHYGIDQAGVWVDCVREKRPVIHNDYPSLPNKKGMPEGHAKVIRELVVPIMREDKIVAILGVGNKPSNYMEKDVEIVSYLADVAWEIAERKQAEEALRKSETQYRLLADNAPDVIWTRDMNFHPTYISPSVQRQRGYTVKEAMEQSLNLSMTPSSVEIVRNILEQEFAIENSGPGDPSRSNVLELEMYRKDGSTIWVEVTTGFYRDDKGQPIGILGINRDITERKQAEEEKEKLEAQLRQAQKMEAVGRLAGGVAHDFNNILTGINGYAEMIIEGLKTDDSLRPRMEVILNAGKRAADLTAQLLAFSRKQVIAPKVIQPNDILLNSQKMLRRIIGEDIDFIFAPGSRLWRINADPTQLDQVLMNLAVNARDAMPDGGKLTIETQNLSLDDEYCKSHAGFIPGDYVMLAVTDTGHGMDEETKSKIFEPFFSTKEVGKGTGLGLATVYGVMKQNKGFINVYSEIYVGTTFKIYFPALKEKAEKLSRDKLADMPAGTETVLLVEDEEIVRNLVKTVLERQGYTVIVAPDGKKAHLEYTQYSGEIDLLLTDVVMPKMNGRELYKKLLDLKPGLRALFMSGYTENAIAHHGVLDKGTHFIQKPFAIQALAKVVRKALDS
jgi:PAS domain S-box-containing protein